MTHVGSVCRMAIMACHMCPDVLLAGMTLTSICVPAVVQGLAFVGSEVITFNAVTNSGLQAEWLAAFLQVKLYSMCLIMGCTACMHNSCISLQIYMRAWLVLKSDHLEIMINGVHRLS